MKAKITPRIRTQNRTPLQNVIPIETPFHIFVDPSSACNFNCKFCFNRDKKRTFHKIMEFGLFKKIIEDLKMFPNKLKVLRMYKEGEPLLNKRLPEMIAYAKKNEVAEKVDFTTNGSLLSTEKNLQLINAGLDAIIISVEGISTEKYYDISGVKLNFQQFVENIKHFYKNRGNCRIHIKTTDINVPDNERNNFYNIFGDICDEISIDKVAPIWPNMDLNGIKESFDTGIYNQKIEPVKICPYIFYSMTVNSDGSVSSCFVDWQHLNILGNVKDESLFDIWHGKKAVELRKIHLEMKRSENSICSNCGQLVYGMADNIDMYREDLMEKITQRYHL